MGTERYGEAMIDHCLQASRQGLSARKFTFLGILGGMFRTVGLARLRLLVVPALIRVPSSSPERVYLEQGRSSTGLDFDFIITGQSDRSLILRFGKVAAYDAGDRLLTYRFVNHNGMNPWHPHARQMNHRGPRGRRRL